MIKDDIYEWSQAHYPEGRVASMFSERNKTLHKQTVSACT